MITQACRFCGTPLTHLFCDLGFSPISNAFIKHKELGRGEMFYPLKAFVCDKCLLVQLCESPGFIDHFHNDYVYFSSFSKSWLAHAKSYVETMTERFGLNTQSKVLEVASNDGYLLQYFVQAGIKCLGVEPTANTAAEARKKGVETWESFFGTDTANKLSKQGWKVDLLLGNNVLAHVPDITDFVAGIPIVLKPNGVATFEFPHLLKLIQGIQFDTIYHEHYHYLSLKAFIQIIEGVGLRVFDVECLSTHGGSLRVFVGNNQTAPPTTSNVQDIILKEEQGGLSNLSTYSSFYEAVREIKLSLLRFFIDAKQEGKLIAGYGAAAKGNTLLNYCGIGLDFIDFIADINPTKQGRYLPGSRIPVVNPRLIRKMKPDYLIILPWNIKVEIIEQLSEIREWGGKFVTLIPKVEILP